MQERSDAPPLSVDEEECMIDLRLELDEMLEWQADDTPERIANGPLTGAEVPPRQGSLKDFLYARRTKAEEEARKAVEMDTEDVTEEAVMEKAGIGGNAEVPHEVEDMDGGYEDEDNEYPLKDADAVRQADEEVSGGDVNIIEGIHRLAIDDEASKQEGSKKDAEMETE